MKNVMCAHALRAENEVLRNELARMEDLVSLMAEEASYYFDTLRDDVTDEDDEDDEEEDDVHNRRDEEATEEKEHNETLSETSDELKNENATKRRRPWHSPACDTLGISAEESASLPARHSERWLMRTPAPASLDVWRETPSSHRLNSLKPSITFSAGRSHP